MYHRLNVWPEIKNVYYMNQSVNINRHILYITSQMAEDQTVLHVHMSCRGSLYRVAKTRLEEKTTTVMSSLDHAKTCLRGFSTG